MSILDPALRDLLAAISLAVAKPWAGDPNLGDRLAVVQGGLDGLVWWGDPAREAEWILLHGVEVADAARVRRADTLALIP
jgi:hypothetical protein